MTHTPTRRKLLSIAPLWVLSSLIAASVDVQASSAQKQPNHPSTYDAAEVNTAPTVLSSIKGLEITRVILLNEGTPEAAISIDVMNRRNEAVMALDFVAGDDEYSGLRIDGLLFEENPVVVIQPHSSETFSWSLSEIMEGRTVFLAAAVFADGKQEGDSRSLNGMRAHRRQFQQYQRDARVENGDHL